MCDQCSGVVRDSIEHEIDAGLVSVGGRIQYVGRDVSAVASLIDGDPTVGPVVMMIAGPGGMEVHPQLAGLEASRIAARKESAARGAHVALATVIKAADLDDGRAMVLRAQYLYEPHNADTLHEMAAAALPEAMAKLAALEPVQKEINPLDPRYFDRLAANMSAYMSRKFEGISAPVFDKWINGLINRNWADATEAELQLLTRQFNTSFRALSGKHWTDIRGQLYHRTEGMGQSVKRATVKRYDMAISPNLALKDIGAIRQITASHAHYVTDAMGNIATGASQQARAIVRNGLAKGLGSKTIGADLHLALGATLKNRTRAYFDMAAISILNRSQSYSKLVTFQEAGVDRMVWISVLDEITTRQCFVAGTTVDTPTGFRNIEDIKPGDLVITGSGHARPVRAIGGRGVLRLVTVTGSNGSVLCVTPEHPIMTTGGWCEAGRLNCAMHQLTISGGGTVGDGSGELSPGQYLSRNGGFTSITRPIAWVRPADPVMVYNLEIDGDPTYFANGILVHNCRFADGKIFSVRKALGNYAKTAALANPQDVKFAQPWLQQRKIKSGADKGLWGLYLPQADGSRTLVSTELVSGMGKVDNHGQWRDAMSIETLEDMGYSAPPGHGGCLLPHSPVLTRDRGIVPVESLACGDKVLTHRGRWKSVEQLGWRWYTGGTTTIRTKAGYVTLTDDHPVAVASGAFVPAGELSDEQPIIQVDQEAMRHVRDGLRDAAEPGTCPVLLDGVPEQGEVEGGGKGNPRSAEATERRPGRAGLSVLRSVVQDTAAHRIAGKGDVLLPGVQVGGTAERGVEPLPAMRPAGETDPRPGGDPPRGVLLAGVPKPIHEAGNRLSSSGHARQRQSDVATEARSAKEEVPLSVGGIRDDETQEQIRGEAGANDGKGAPELCIRAGSVQNEGRQDVCPGLLSPGDRSVSGEQGTDQELASAYRRRVRRYAWPNSLDLGEVAEAFRGDIAVKIVRGHARGVRVYSFDVIDDETAVTGCGVLVHNCRSTIGPDMIPPRTRTRRVQTPAPKPRKPLIDPMGAKGPAHAVTGNGALDYYDRLRLMQAEEAVALGRKPAALSKYDGVLNRVKATGTPPVFSTPKGLGLAPAQALAAKRISGILLAAMPEAVSRLREVRLSARLAAKDAYGAVQYDERAKVLTMSKEAASDKTPGGKQATGRQLAYALELERRQAKTGTITAEDRAAARQADLTNSVGTLFDAEALEKAP